MVAGVTKRPRQAKTSVFLEVFFYFGGIYDAVWWIAELVIFVYKGLTLPYPTANYSIEFTLLWLYLLVNPPRLFLGSKGNKTESQTTLLFSICLSLPLIAIHIYYMLFQTYVLRFELILNAVSLFFIGIQGIISLLTMISFSRR